MNTNRMSRRKKWLVAGGMILLVLAILAGVFFWYVSDYYRAEDAALEILAQDSGITVQDNLTMLSPAAPTDTAMIFYPGAKVEAEAYLPLLDQIRQTGITCILVHMPFHMAIFDANAAEDVIDQFPAFQHWYIAGHSMGGAMASQFASDHPDQIDGLILMGAYIYGDYPAEKTLTIYGSLNQSVEDILTTQKILWKSRAATTPSSATTAPRRAIFPRQSLPRNSKNRQWRPLKPFWHSRQPDNGQSAEGPAGAPRFPDSHRSRTIKNACTA